MKLLWLQKISNHSTSKPTNRKFTKGENGRIGTVQGVDFAGPVKYLSKSKREMKAHIVLYACCLTRAVYLEILPNVSVEEAIRRIQRLIARRGRLEKIFLDNGKTFVAAAKWLRKIRNDEKLYALLAKQGIAWQFNLGRAPLSGANSRG